MKTYTEEEAESALKAFKDFFEATAALRQEGVVYAFAIGVPTGDGSNPDAVTYKTAHFLTAVEPAAVLAVNGFVLLAPQLIPSLFLKLSNLLGQVFAGCLDSGTPLPVVDPSVVN